MIRSWRLLRSAPRREQGRRAVKYRKVKMDERPGRFMRLDPEHIGASGRELGDLGSQGVTFADLARKAESCGFTGVYTIDHFVLPRDII